MDSFKNRLREAMEYRNIKPSELAKLTGIGKSSISQWLTGKYEAKQDKTFKLSKALNIDPSWLMGADVPMFNETLITKIKNTVLKLSSSRQENVLLFAEKQLKQQNSSNVVNLDDYGSNQTSTIVDVYGSVSAGTGEYLDDIKPEKFSIKGPVPDDYDFAVRVNGRSMEPTFNDGQIILVKKVVDDSEVRNNQFIIAEVNGEAFVKKLFVSDNMIRLISLNPKYKDIFINEFDDFVVRGVVVF
ncbi:MAG: LexA family transcriptional regulator [Liquorilactobacillus hordei]|uniref:LexA family transcriptional regulator n=1 Tax=Liquorilactobacillus hordei TaxID=468911 RepID=UPI0039EB09F0